MNITLRVFFLSAYLRSSVYVEGLSKADKRRIRERSLMFRLRGDCLIHVTSCGKETKVVEDENARNALVEEMHKGVGGVHYGQTATLSKVTERHWWPGVSLDVRAHIRSCLKCQRANPANRPPASTLHPVTVHHLFHRWGIYLIGPTPNNAKGKQVHSCCN